MPTSRNPAPDAPSGASTFVRVRSHRAADRLRRLLGVSRLDWHFNMWEGNEFVLIPAERVTEARKIPGVTVARTRRELHRCWQ
jgi:hypothetical protein